MDKMLLSAAEPLLGRQKIPKLSHKKEQERQQYDILQIDEQIRAAFQIENSKTSRILLNESCQ